VLRLDLKREVFNNTWSIPVKYFTAIPLRVYPKIFADAGYITSPSPGNSFLSNQVLYCVGVGLDVVTLYDIKIRFELAWNHLNQNGLYLHFNSE
jgi:hemolysin activation/secretion protein